MVVIAVLIGVCAAQLDARYDHVLSLIRSDTFGWADFFEPLVNSISVGGDFYLLANDFVSYLEAQACPPPGQEAGDKALLAGDYVVGVGVTRVQVCPPQGQGACAQPIFAQGGFLLHEHLRHIMLCHHVANAQARLLRLHAASAGCMFLHA